VRSRREKISKWWNRSQGLFAFLQKTGALIELVYEVINFIHLPMESLPIFGEIIPLGFQLRKFSPLLFDPGEIL
jgi:hypothetical protein